MATPPNDLPAGAATAFQNLTEDQQMAFNGYYAARRRDTFLMVLLAVIFPVQLFLLGKIWLGLLFWLTGGGFLIWYFIEWFLTPARVREYNSKVAGDALRLIASGKTLAQTAGSDEEE